MKIVGLSGLGGSGKSTVAGVLVASGYVEVALADVMKRFVRDLFGWSNNDLWGPSENRNRPDVARGGLTPRHALQFLGTEVGRQLYADVWVDYALNVVDQLSTGDYRYLPGRGVLFLDHPADPPKGVVLSDIRFPNEVKAVRARGGKVWRKQGGGLSGAAAAHASETSIDVGECDIVIPWVEDKTSLISLVRGLL